MDFRHTMLNACLLFRMKLSIFVCAKRHILIMSNGLYIHIPFCSKRCIYCDFYSTTFNADIRSSYVDALCNELTLRADYLPNRILRSVYLGGGTPSQLLPSELERIFDTISKLFVFEPLNEITLEANPDDFSTTYTEALACLPVNRISLGIQSFDDNILRLLNRRHNSREALEAVERACHLTDNVSVDLIYGLPGQTLELWNIDLNTAFTLPITHLSAYALMYEEGTQLWNLRRNGNFKETDEELSLKMFTTLMDRTKEVGFEHYEISNFALPGRRAVHNSGYWHNMTYLGCGPAAHSYNGRSRRLNLPELKAYIRAGGDTSIPALHEEETLTRQMLYNETVMKSLRTYDGIDLSRFEEKFGQEAVSKLLTDARKHLDAGRLEIIASGKSLHLTRKGIFVSDDVMSDLFLVENKY